MSNLKEQRDVGAAKHATRKVSNHDVDKAKAIRTQDSVR